MTRMTRADAASVRGRDTSPRRPRTARRAIPTKPSQNLLIDFKCVRHDRTKLRAKSIQRHAAPDVGRHVQILAVADGRLAFLEAASENDLQRQLLLQARQLFARTAALDAHDVHPPFL